MSGNRSLEASRRLAATDANKGTASRVSGGRRMVAWCAGVAFL